MRSFQIHIVSVCALLISVSSVAQILPNLGGQRTGSSTLVFLKNDASARSVGMGGANVTLKLDGMSTFNNPAAADGFKTTNLSLSNFFIGNGINQSFFSAILPWNKRRTNFMLTVNNLSSGKQEVRTEFQPQGTGEYFYVTNTAFGFGASKVLSDQFSMGLKLKYIFESMAQYRSHSFAVDLGFLYSTDIRELSFAVTVNNFGGSSSISGNHQEVNTGRALPPIDSYTLPTTFKLGVSMLAIEKEYHKLRAAVQLNHPNDNSENLRFGLEYIYRQILSIRGGYILGRATYKFPTFGVGINTRLGHHPFEINYAVVPSNRIGLQHSLALSFTFHKPEERE